MYIWNKFKLVIMQGKYLEADGLDPKVIYFLVNTVGAYTRIRARLHTHTHTVENKPRKLNIFHINVRST